MLADSRDRHAVVSPVMAKLHEPPGSPPRGRAGAAPRSGAAVRAPDHERVAAIRDAAAQAPDAGAALVRRAQAALRSRYADLLPRDTPYELGEAAVTHVHQLADEAFDRRVAEYNKDASSPPDPKQVMGFMDTVKGAKELYVRGSQDEVPRVTTIAHELLHTLERLDTDSGGFHEGATEYLARQAIDGRAPTPDDPRPGNYTNEVTRVALLCLYVPGFTARALAAAYLQAGPAALRAAVNDALKSPHAWDVVLACFALTPQQQFGPAFVKDPVDPRALLQDLLKGRLKIKASGDTVWISQ